MRNFLNSLSKGGALLDALLVLVTPLIMTLLGLYLTYRGHTDAAIVVGCAGIIMYHANARDRVKRSGYL